MSIILISISLKLFSRDLCFTDKNEHPLLDVIGTLPQDVRDRLRDLVDIADFEHLTVKIVCEKDKPGTAYHFCYYGRYTMVVS